MGNWRSFGRGRCCARSIPLILFFVVSLGHPRHQLSVRCTTHSSRSSRLGLVTTALQQLSQPQHTHHMAVGPKHLVAAAGAFGLGMYGCYTWAVTQQALQQQLSKATASTEDHQCHGQCAFDRLAGVYDSIVDWEESSMFYGLMRSRLLSKAQVRRSKVQGAAACPQLLCDVAPPRARTPPPTLGRLAQP